MFARRRGRIRDRGQQHPVQVVHVRAAGTRRTGIVVVCADDKPVRPHPRHRNPKVVVHLRGRVQDAGLEGDVQVLRNLGHGDGTVGDRRRGNGIGGQGIDRHGARGDLTRAYRATRDHGGGDGPCGDGLRRLRVHRIGCRRNALIGRQQLAIEPHPQPDIAVGEELRGKRRHIGEIRVAQQHRVESLAHRRRDGRGAIAPEGRHTTPVDQGELEGSGSSEIRPVHHHPALGVDKTRHLGMERQAQGYRQEQRDQCPARIGTHYALPQLLSRSCITIDEV